MLLLTNESHTGTSTEAQTSCRSSVVSRRLADTCCKSTKKMWITSRFSYFSLNKGSKRSAFREKNIKPWRISCNFQKMSLHLLKNKNKYIIFGKLFESLLHTGTGTLCTQIFQPYRSNIFKPPNFKPIN